MNDEEKKLREEAAAKVSARLHPPIPENSASFRKIISLTHGYFMGWEYVRPDGGTVWLSYECGLADRPQDLFRRWRKTIADVAEVAWRKVYEEREDALHAWIRNHPHSPVSDWPDHGEQVALDNTVAWRVWGLQK